MTNECEVSAAVKTAGSSTNPTFFKYIALWDTGATGSVITSKVVTDCGLVATGKTTVNNVHESKIKNTYLVNIRLPGGLTVQGLTVTEGDMKGFDVLIGMDIIVLGDFAVTHKGGKTKFTFRIPSLSDIDYVAIHKTDLVEEAAVQRKAARMPKPTNKKKSKPTSKFKYRKKK